MGNYLKKDVSEKQDFRNRFEFILTMTNSRGQENIICQRYFKIDYFNPVCTGTSRLTDTIVRCAKMINKDLKEKSNIYTEYTAPRVFENEEEMREYFKNPDHCVGMVPGEGIVLREPEAPNYVFHKDGPKLSPTKFYKTEFTHELTEEDMVTFKLTFIDHATFKWVEEEPRIINPKTGKKETSYNEDGTVFHEYVDNEFGNEKGRILCSYSWTNVLPRIVRNAIDLENNTSKYTDKETLTLGGDESIFYKMNAGRTSLSWRIIKEICRTCSNSNYWWLQRADPFGEESFIQ